MRLIDAHKLMWGEWHRDPDHPKMFAQCNQCGLIISMSAVSDHKFCFNCGAEMIDMTDNDEVNNG